jgi:hypothetical protein
LREWIDLDKENNYRVEGAVIRGHLEGPFEWGRIEMNLDENGVLC